MIDTPVLSGLLEVGVEPRPAYLFIRVLEACDAGCNMCGFRHSKDRFRFSTLDLGALLDRAVPEGVRYVRFTGGEPLLHREIVPMVGLCHEYGVLASLITNGGTLMRHLSALRAAGLSQVVVSIDGLETTHDSIRQRSGLWRRAMAGIEQAISEGIHARVNTVCGPENFREMPALQSLLTSLGVEQWELSSLKLERRLLYLPEDVDALEAVVKHVYREGPATGLLRPLGKPWCGGTPTERARYLETGATPRPDEVCNVVDQVRYLDAKNGRLFACSLLPHRPHARHMAARVAGPSSYSGHAPDIVRQADYYREHGPAECTGCSATAAGFSNAIKVGAPLPPWAY